MIFTSNNGWISSCHGLTSRKALHRTSHFGENQLPVLPPLFTGVFQYIYICIYIYLVLTRLHEPAPIVGVEGTAPFLFSKYRKKVLNVGNGRMTHNNMNNHPIPPFPKFSASIWDDDLISECQERLVAFFEHRSTRIRVWSEARHTKFGSLWEFTSFAMDNDHGYLIV